VNLEIHQ